MRVYYTTNKTEETHYAMLEDYLLESRPHAAKCEAAANSWARKVGGRNAVASCGDWSARIPQFIVVKNGAIVQDNVYLYLR